MALLQLIFLMLASQVALDDAAANQLPREESNVLEMFTKARAQGSSAFNAPPFLIDMYKDLSNTETAGEAPKMVGIPGKKLGKSFRFDVPEDFRHDLGVTASLFVFLPSCDTAMTVSMYDVKSGEQIQSSRVACTGSGWTPVKLDDLNAHIVRALRVEIDGAHAVEQPPWIVYTERSAETPPRKRRSVVPGDAKPGECRRVDKFFTPAKHNWDRWLIPRVINLYRCRGSCPISRIGTLGTIHARVMASLGSGDEDSDEQLCCVPTKLSSAHVLAMDRGNILSVVVPDMIVEECGCSFSQHLPTSAHAR